MLGRQQHQPEVLAFLQKKFSCHHWEITLPWGAGNETYFAQGNGRTYFVKLNAPVANYEVMASIGLTPSVIATGFLGDGTSVLVQPYIAGKKPSRKDFHAYLEQFAAMIRKVHHCLELQQALPGAASDLYCAAGLDRLAGVQRRWQRCKAQVPAVAEFVDQSIASLEQQIRSLPGAGLVASHNDICNANWLIAPDGKIYLIDLDAVGLDDPACDLGAILWWYYPPELRPRFLEVAGYANDEQFRKRMQLRMAVHCLHILLPREHSFDSFEPEDFDEALTDFRAILAGKENPQGYD